MVQFDEQIVNLIRSFADFRQISLSYASMLLTGSGDTVSRIEGGMSLTGRRAAKIVEAASGRWPPSQPWPEAIPRPCRSEAGLVCRGAANSRRKRALSPRVPSASGRRPAKAAAIEIPVRF